MLAQSKPLAMAPSQQIALVGRKKKTTHRRHELLNDPVQMLGVGGTEGTSAEVQGELPQGENIPPGIPGQRHHPV